jgi:hypothetical protein
MFTVDLSDLLQIATNPLFLQAVKGRWRNATSPEPLWYRERARTSIT